MSDSNRPTSPLLNEKDCEKLIQDLFKSGDISSDGYVKNVQSSLRNLHTISFLCNFREFSAIARQEISKLNYSVDAATEVLNRNLPIWIVNANGEDQPPPSPIVIAPGNYLLTYFKRINRLTCISISGIFPHSESHATRTFLLSQG